MGSPRSRGEISLMSSVGSFDEKGDKIAMLAEIFILRKIFWELFLLRTTQKLGHLCGG